MEQEEGEGDGSCAQKNAFIASLLRACEIITSHFRIPSSGQVRPIFTRAILNVALATPAVGLPQIDPTWPKSWREFWGVIVLRALSSLMRRVAPCVEYFQLPGGEGQPNSLVWCRSHVFPGSQLAPVSPRLLQ